MPPRLLALPRSLTKGGRAGGRRRICRKMLLFLHGKREEGGSEEGEHSGGGAEDVALRAENSFLGVNDFSADLHFHACVE